MPLRIFKALDEGGLSAFWEDIVIEVGKGVTQVMNWAKATFVHSVNGKTGYDITLNKGDVGLGNVDNTADANKRVAYAAQAGDADTLDGKHASDFVSSEDYNDFEIVTADALNDLDQRKVDKEDGKGLSENDFTDELKEKLEGIEDGAQKHIAPTNTEITTALGYIPANADNLVDYTVTVDTAANPTQGYLKTYEIKQKGTTIGKIDIPKDLVVSSGSVVRGTWNGDVFTENASGSGKAVKLVIANQTTPIYINVADLVDVYTAQQNATEIQLAISATNEISATLVQSVKNKIDNAIPKVNNATGKVAMFKADGTLVSTGYTLGKDVTSESELTDYKTTKAGHYSPSEESGSQLTANASGATAAWEIDVVKGITVKRDSKGHVVGIGVTSGKIPANPNTDYQTTKAGHYTPSADAGSKLELTEDTDGTDVRIIAVGNVIERDSKGHVTGFSGGVVRALTDEEIHEIIATATARIAADQ